MIRTRKPLLIVPVRDRRQRRRILTIRNCALSMLTAAVLVASISIYQQSRRGTADQYGRLFGTQVPAQNANVTRKDDIISEGPVADQSASDPMLAAPAAREQVPLDTAVPVATATIAPDQPIAAVQPIPPAEGHGTTIVGDGRGVSIVKASATSTAPQPALSGGIFKEH
jgi:hypothetical protein